VFVGQVCGQRTNTKRNRISKTEHTRYQALRSGNNIKHGLFFYYKHLGDFDEELEKGQYFFNQKIGKWRFMHAHRTTINELLLHNFDSTYFYQNFLLGYHKHNHQEHLVFKDFYYIEIQQKGYLRKGFTDKKGNKIGLWKTTFQDGLSCLQVYVNDTLHDKAVSFYPSGDTCTKRYYHNGVQVGPQTTFYPNGEKLYYSFPTLDSSLHILSYLPGNKLHQHCIFKNGKIISVTTKNVKGNKIEQSQVDSGNGPLRLYEYRNKDLQLSGYCKLHNGEIEGEYYSLKNEIYPSYLIDARYPNQLSTQKYTFNLTPYSFMSFTQDTFYRPPICIGDSSNMDRHFEYNFKMPQEAINEGVWGTAKINFVVTEDGDITNIKIAKLANFHSGRYVQLELQKLMLRTKDWWAPSQFFGFPIDSPSVYEFYFPEY